MIPDGEYTDFIKIGQPKLSERKLTEVSCLLNLLNVGSKMSLLVNDNLCKCTILGAGSSPLKFALVTYSKIFII
jgi:hypothetical protein